jgi:hypothetical protein
MTKYLRKSDEVLLCFGVFGRYTHLDLILARHGAPSCSQYEPHISSTISTIGKRTRLCLTLIPGLVRFGIAVIRLYKPLETPAGT